MNTCKTIGAELIELESRREVLSEEELMWAAQELRQRKHFYKEISDACISFKDRLMSIELGAAAILMLIDTALSKRGYGPLHEKLYAASEELDLILNNQRT